MTYRETVNLGETVLSMADIAEAKTDAWLLLEMVCKIDRSFYYLHMEEDMPEEQMSEYQIALRKRAEHVPLQYIVGETEFMGLKFKVNSSVLIPRQDTETLVEEALKVVRPGMRVLDLCTGSGCVIVSILHNVSDVEGYAVDISKQALNVAKENARLNDVPVLFEHSDLFDHVTGTFDVIVSNPPFAVPWEGDKNPKLVIDPRFSPAGVLAPASKGDMAFIMHSLSWLASNGAAAIVCFPGIMYRGGAEQKIRKYLVDNNYVDAIIQLPSNLFMNVTISVDIMLLKKNKTDNAVLFVDASKEFVKVKKNNRLSDDNIRRIVSAVAERKDERYFARLVPNDEVGSKQNNYNLSVSTYVEQEDTREKIDIIKLNAEIAEIVAREQKLREEIDRIIEEIEG